MFVAQLPPKKKTQDLGVDVRNESSRDIFALYEKRNRLDQKKKKREIDIKTLIRECPIKIYEGTKSPFFLCPFNEKLTYH